MWDFMVTYFRDTCFCHYLCVFEPRRVVSCLLNPLRGENHKTASVQWNKSMSSNIWYLILNWVFSGWPCLNFTRTGQSWKLIWAECNTAWERVWELSSCWTCGHVYAQWLFSKHPQNCSYRLSELLKSPSPPL